MSTQISMNAPYDYVLTKEVISHVEELLLLDKSLSGTNSSSVYIEQHKGINNLLSLRGLGKNVWENQDAQEYINELREEWKE